MIFHVGDMTRAINDIAGDFDYQIVCNLNNICFVHIIIGTCNNCKF